MSSEPQQQQNNQEIPPQEESQPEDPDALTEEDKEAYQNISATLQKMHTKIQKVKHKMNQDQNQKKNKQENVAQIATKLIQSKENSEIITKENLLTDITESYDTVVVEMYSENQRLKKKIDDMAKIIHEQNNKIYEHISSETYLKNENQKLKDQINKLKDERLVAVRNPGQSLNQNLSRSREKEQNAATTKKTKNAGNGGGQDYDFWSMPNDNYGKKKKEVIENSGLWVNQKDIHESVFLTEEPNKKKKK